MTNDMKYEEGDLNEPSDDLDESAIAHLAGKREAAPLTDDEYSAKVKKRIGKEVSRRKTIESERDVYRSELDKANAELAQLRVTAAERQKKHLESETEALRGLAKTAMEEGEVDKYIEINEKLLDRRVEMAAMGNQVNSQAVKKVEMEKKGGPSQAAQAWLDANEWVQTDDVRAGRAQEVERQLRREGYSVEDSETYDELDRRLNPTKQRKDATAEMVNTPGNSIPNVNGGKRLSAADLEIMQGYGMDPKNPAHRAEWLTAKSETGA